MIRWDFISAGGSICGQGRMSNFHRALGTALCNVLAAFRPFCTYHPVWKGEKKKNNRRMWLPPNSNCVCLIPSPNWVHKLSVLQKQVLMHACVFVCVNAWGCVCARACIYQSWYLYLHAIFCVPSPVWPGSPRRCRVHPATSPSLSEDISRLGFHCIARVSPCLCQKHCPPPARPAPHSLSVLPPSLQAWARKTIPS